MTTSDSITSTYFYPIIIFAAFGIMISLGYFISCLRWLYIQYECKRIIDREKKQTSNKTQDDFGLSDIEIGWQS